MADSSDTQGETKLASGIATPAVAALRTAILRADPASADANELRLRPDREILLKWSIPRMMSRAEEMNAPTAVSYTHLTLPTILSV